MNISDLPPEFSEMKIPLKQAMEEAMFIRDSFTAEIKEHTDEETYQKIKAGVDRRAVARTLDKLDELSNVLEEFSDDAPETGGAKASVTQLSDYFKSQQ